MSPSKLLGRWAVPLSGVEGTVGWPGGRWHHQLLCLGKVQQQVQPLELILDQVQPLELVLDQSLWLEPQMEAQVVYLRVFPQPQCSPVGPSESVVVCVEISLQW